MIVVDIAMAVGYENASKFSMAFRKGMDGNSLDYRKYTIHTEVNPNEE
ncbi:MAG: helix-turn-helix domain-containing protein [Oscillospiraceae bacterium]|nr:helix-turn-helix domain-containing protein [Oscillospiraceae bacterium]